MLVVDVVLEGPTSRLQGMADRLTHTGPLMKMLAHGLEEYEREVFATSGRGTWAPDDPDTVELKGTGRTLVDSGNLLRELTSAKISGDTVRVVNGDAFYARFLRDGDRGMPRRNPAPAPPRSTVSKWADQVLGYVIDGRTR